MSEGLGTVPEGLYNLKVHKSEYVSTPKTAGAKGPYIKAQLVITSYRPHGEANRPEVDNAEQYVGRFVFQNYSLTGDGSFRLRQLLEATGHPADFKLTDSDMLVGLEFAAAVVIKAGTGGYSDKNEVGKHLPLV